MPWRRGSHSVSSPAPCAWRLQSKASDVSQLVGVGVICYLKQLLETGFFHADPHPGEGLRMAWGSGGWGKVLDTGFVLHARWVRLKTRGMRASAVDATR